MIVPILKIPSSDGVDTGVFNICPQILVCSLRLGLQETTVENSNLVLVGPNFLKELETRSNAHLGFSIHKKD